MYKVKIARVFARKTNLCPTDKDAYFGVPGFFTPEYDEVHISVTFTWDIEYAEFLAKQWKTVSPKVLIGGPAIRGLGIPGVFKPGVYLKKGVTITSRGCPYDCSHCFVQRREGGIQELPIYPGNIMEFPAGRCVFSGSCHIIYPPGA